MSNIGNMDTMARNLSYYMAKHNVSQKELADVAGVSVVTVSYWLHAKRYPRIDKIEMMAEYFGIMKSDLIEEPQTKKAPAPDPEAEARERLVSILMEYTPDELQRIMDFAAGIKASRE